MTITKYDPCAGTTIEESCAYMADNAPCEATLNGILMRSVPGDTAGALCAYLRDAMDKRSEEQKLAQDHQEKMAAYARATCAGEVTRALVVLNAGDVDTAKRLLTAELRRLMG